MFPKPLVYLYLLCMAPVLQAEQSIQSSPPEPSRARYELVTTGERTVRSGPSWVAHREQLALSIEGGDLEPGATGRPGAPQGGNTTTSVAPDNSPATIQQWHTVELDFEGPTASERGRPNPFTDYRLDVVFAHKDERYRVRGFFAADGNAANTGAASGNVWRVRFTPRHVGRWRYKATLKRGKAVALSAGAAHAQTVALAESKGTFQVIASDKALPDFRARGFIEARGPYFAFRDSDQYWMKAGANSPENILGFHEFDGTYRHDQGEREGEASAGDSLHRFEPHRKDWRVGDPTWAGGKGKSLIGAYNYLADKGMNASYFLTMNINGDGRDVWPFVSHTDFSRFDVSKLAQWNIVFDHMQSRGILLHMVIQETENERLLDDGDVGPQRQLYLNELIARFAHHPGLAWNLGEENGPAEFSPHAQNDAQRRAMSSYFRQTDPYHHPVLLHTHSTPEGKDDVITPQLGHKPLDGLSFQVNLRPMVNAEIQRWRQLSRDAGKEWLITMDEIGSWEHGAVPDADDPDHDRVRRQVLWGSLLGGGAGVEWYFGARHAATDLTSEDWRLRDRLWAITNHARQFFERYVPYWAMAADNDLIDSEGSYAFAKPNHLYVAYLPKGVATNLDLRGAQGAFEVHWFDPLKGGDLQLGSAVTLTGGQWTALGSAPSRDDRDWVVLVRRIRE